MKKFIYMLSLLTVFSLLLVACGDDTGDLLAKIEKKGAIHISTDANYAPQSFLKPNGAFSLTARDEKRYTIYRCGCCVVHTLSLVPLVSLRRESSQLPLAKASSM